MARVLLISMALTRDREASGAELFPVRINIYLLERIIRIP
jgi:hypothetical protein